MLCPNCARNLTPDSVIKVDVKGINDVDIVYDAICPYCYVEIGRMYWGELILNKSMPETAWIKTYKQPGQTKPEPVETGETMPEDTITRVTRICPHCGGDLPEDLNSLPIKRTGQDRRKGERRVAERRRNDVIWMEIEHRDGDRRVADRRVASRREEDRKAAEAATPVQEEPRGEYTSQRVGERRKSQQSILYERRASGGDRRRKPETEWRA